MFLLIFLEGFFDYVDVVESIGILNIKKIFGVPNLANFIYFLTSYKPRI